MIRSVSLLACCLLLSPAFAQKDLSTDLDAILKELKAPDDFGLRVLPKETTLESYSIKEKELHVLLNFPLEFLYQDLDDERLDEIIENFSAEISIFNFDGFHLKAKNEGGNYRELSHFISENPLAIAPDIKNNDEGLAIKGKRFVDRYSDVQPKGQLNGNTVWLSAGHGWIYDRRFKSYKTQRHNHHGVVEDFSNIEAINYHLLKYLYNAGANVWTVRERDMNPNEVIVDNDAGSPAYREYGRWATSSTRGRNNKSYRYAISNKKETATAVFTPTIPKSGMYWVSVHYQNGLNRSVDTRYRILHAGGESHVSINQEIHGNTWVYLGQFYFEKGNEGKVIVSNESHETSQAIIADAIRFGGGMGSVGDCSNGKRSGVPRYEEGAKYYAQYQGYPDCEGDVSIRPKYAEWELAKGSRSEQDHAIYLSWHSNASGAQGTESFVHRYKRRIGSRHLQRSIHQQIIQDIRKGYDSNWADRGQKSADFGELRGLRTMPGVLLEVGFHDNPNDAKAITDPKFRNLIARATYKGIVNYFASRKKKEPVYLPEPPTHLTATNVRGGKIKLHWKAPNYGGILGDKAKAYKVYISQHGKAFASGILSKENDYTFENLLPGTTYYFRITAINSGGESFPTAVVAARTPKTSDERTEYLIVDGFDRLDRSLSIIKKETKPRYSPLGNTRRLFIEQMNNYDYASEHASSLSAAGISFDGACNEAVEDRLIDLNDYFGLNWFLGRESSDDQTLSRKEQQLLKTFLDKGGVLIISGSELAFDLVKSNNGAAFYRNYLKADFVQDDAQHFKVTSSMYGDFNGLAGNIRNNDYGFYHPKSPDVLRPIKGGRTALKYPNGKTAAVSYKGKYAVINFGFPLEAIGDDLVRDDLFKKSIQFLDPQQEVTTGIASVPKSFSSILIIDMGDATEGKIIFNLYDAFGKAIIRRSKSYSGKGDWEFDLKDIAKGLYTYELEVNGQRQSGMTVKH